MEFTTYPMATGKYHPKCGLFSPPQCDTAGAGKGGKQDLIQSLWKARGCRTAAAGAQRVWVEEGSKGQTWCWRNTQGPRGASGGKSSCEMWLLLHPPGTNPSSGRAGPFPAAGSAGMGPWLELAPSATAALAPALLRPPPRHSHPQQAGAGRQKTSRDFIDIKRAI